MPIETLIIPVQPTAQQRHRHSGKFAYKSKSQVANEKELIYYLKQQWQIDPLECPIHLSVAAFFELPKSYSKKKAEAFNPGYKPTKPDLSNIIKQIEDCANGIIWKDDAQIVSYFDCGKYWADDPCWVVRVKF